ncbi:MAG: stage III sporulation protein AA [Sporomusaceae bacterium]|nr:stage III sporulation protein AA [Sporomusaceae bacterium]
MTLHKDKTKNLLEEFIFPILPPHLVTMINGVPAEQLACLTEIRLRANRVLLLVLGNVDIMLSPRGKVVIDQNAAYQCSREDINTTLQLISKNSLYAFEQELKMGFLTINGGHRVGLTGQTVVDGGEIKALKNFSSLNIRMAREIKGCGDKVMPYIIAGGKSVLSTLVISAPCCGKTTLLRDLIRQISMGNTEFRGLQVGVVDERSEIAACKNGIPTVDLGQRTDVLDGCPKASGMLMLIRSMSPAVVATDELGRAEDVCAVREALHAGVSVLATVHGRDINEVLQRPYVGELIQHKYFDRYVVLSDRPKVGTIEKIIDSKRDEILWNAPQS